MTLARLPYSSVALQFYAVLLLFWFRAEGEVWAAIVLIISSLFLLQMTIKNMALPIRSFLPKIMYLLVASAVVVPSLEQMLASFCLMMSYWYTCQSLSGKYGFSSVFHSGVFLSLGALFSFECLFFLPTLILGMWTLKRTLREVVITLTGALLPLFLACYVNWGFLGADFSDFLVDGFHSVGWGGCQGAVLYANHAWFALAFMIAVVLNLSLSLWCLSQGWFDTRRRTLRLNLFFFWQVIAASLIFIFSSSANIYSLMAVPFSVIMAFTYLRLPKLWGWVLYSFLLIFAVLAGLC